MTDYKLLPEQNLTWRELTAANTNEFQALANRIETADQLPYRTSANEINALFDDDAQMIAIGGWKDNTLRSYAFVRIRESNQAHAMCQGGVDPQFRNKGIGRSLVNWLTDTAKKMLTKTNNPTGIIEFYVEDGNSELEYHLTGLGYQWRRSFYDLRADLQTEITIPKLNTFFTIAPWESVSESEILEIENRVSYEQRKRSPQTLSTWLSGRTDFKANWSYIALDQRADRPVIAGFIMASAYTQDWQTLGWQEGTIDQIAVLENYRDQSLAEALIAASMNAQKTSGMEYTATGLSSTNAQIALGIYKKLGFDTVATAKLFSLNI